MTTQEKIVVMQAWLAGKEIEVKEKGTTVWNDVQRDPHWNWLDNEYRVKPEPKEPTYRHYASFAEFRAEWEKHGGWVLNRNSNYYYLLCNIDEPQHLCKNYVWADDGKPCGIKVED